ncbi:uncharacterized protein B0H64DRAFT_206004 [Chaetomium fimeti]|uniref:Uncharacterized protein n=1 Tax=Chaetomium fimeti TaxID=1854472 RepID=A0AAE0HAX6_9PEZI|nr:hypothetical protein B0H64DRAFT_206004 [Chaetomium fimeti]
MTTGSQAAATCSRGGVNTHAQPPPRRGAVPCDYDERSAPANRKTAAAASTLLARELKGRHLQIIAISGSVGTGAVRGVGQGAELGRAAGVGAAGVSEGRGRAVVYGAGARGDGGGVSGGGVVFGVFDEVCGSRSGVCYGVEVAMPCNGSLFSGWNIPRWRGWDLGLPNSGCPILCTYMYEVHVGNNCAFRSNRTCQICQMF